MIAATKKRLLHVVGGATRGGCETNCAVFIHASPEFEHQVLVLGDPGVMSEHWVSLGATVAHLGLLDTGWMEFLRRWRAALDGAAGEGAIVWSGIRVPLVLAGLARIGCPTVIHAGNPFAASWRVRLLLATGGWFLPRPANLTVVSCSEHVARSYRIAPFFRGLPVEACLNPVAIPAASPHRLRELTPSDPVRLGMVARLDPIKDHATLIKAFGLVRERWPRAELHLAGDGPLRGSFESLARDLGVGQAVHFHGSISTVPSFLDSLDVFCFLTTEQEGMGNALAEALAHGLPCVVSDLPVMREVVGEPPACAALLASAQPGRVAEAIDDLLRDVEARRWLSDAARQRAGSVFSPRRVVDRYWACLQGPS